jgi:hypothetical protein
VIVMTIQVLIASAGFALLLLYVVTTAIRGIKAVSPAQVSMPPDAVQPAE